ncbi:unnamed protein product [Lymnaea stagnalis]|uniref:NFX1-type zinc finger-containing protein 1 n=1 Tax=Lymnaea stagnalis TaxID=6523 RepID=A0AAV2H6C7_LYMST
MSSASRDSVNSSPRRAAKVPLSKQNDTKSNDQVNGSRRDNQATGAASRINLPESDTAQRQVANIQGRELLETKRSHLPKQSRSEHPPQRSPEGNLTSSVNNGRGSGAIPKTPRQQDQGPGSGNERLSSQNRLARPQSENYDNTKPRIGRAQLDVPKKQYQFYSVEEKRVKSTITSEKLAQWACQPKEILIVQMKLDTPAINTFLNEDDIACEDLRNFITALHRLTIGKTRILLSDSIIFQCFTSSPFLNVHLRKFLEETQMFQEITDILHYIKSKFPKFWNSKCIGCLNVFVKTGASLNIFEEDDKLMREIKELQKKVTSSLNNFSSSNQTVTAKSNINYTLSDTASQDKRPTTERSRPRLDDDEPDDDFTALPLFPDTEDLFSEVEPFLRANKTRGPYRDVQHYLDVHARLIREDYLEPIRNGLKHFKETRRHLLSQDWGRIMDEDENLIKELQKKTKDNDLRFYFNVKLLDMFNDVNDGIALIVNFDNTQLQDVDWKNSKRFMYGALLVFSKDFFETTIFATVAERKDDLLEQGQVQVIFQNNLEEVFTASESDRFIIAETTAYFESHRHVLEGLQEMKRLPLEQYIIKCERQIRPPEYVTGDTFYNLSAIIRGKHTQRIPILDTEEWPEASETDLNDSQLEALKLALTNEISLIQGPPGTGKTYVGLKVVEILLQNSVRRTLPGRHRPILVVCYTNHALDQFLEGILEFSPEGVIRVGRQSTSEKLEKLNLNNMRLDRQSYAKIQQKANIDWKGCEDSLELIIDLVKRCWQDMKRLESTILKVNDLAEEMSEEQIRSLTDPTRRTGMSSDMMSAWLKASNAKLDLHLNALTRRHLITCIANGRYVQESINLTNVPSVMRLDFKSRVNIYRTWASQYQQQKLRINYGIESSQLSQECSREIIQDSEIRHIIGENIYQSIQECVKKECKKDDFDNDIIKHWLIGKFKTTDQFLDAIDLLYSTMPYSKKPQAVGAKPEVIELLDNSDRVGESSSESEDEDDDEEDSAADERTQIRLSEIREHVDKIKQAESKEMSMLKRAEMLGVDVSGNMEEGDDEEDDAKSEAWQTVSKSMSYKKVFDLLRKTVPYKEEEASEITDVWELRLEDRYRLYKYWVHKKMGVSASMIHTLTEEYNKLLKKKKRIRFLKTVEILKRAQVVGMTTTAAARWREVLKAVACPIVVVEEAAEVLEAHVVTTLNRKCQHLILIGDHQQLRPNPTVHRLAKEFQLEISLFERLVNNKVKHVLLNQQHRMRPEISTYIKHIYPQLQDHVSVSGYGDIRGVASNVFFLQHNEHENSIDDTRSKANIHEAKFITALCKYFLQQGYNGHDITVLAAYSGQVALIKKVMGKKEKTKEENREVTVKPGNEYEDVDYATEGDKEESETEPPGPYDDVRVTTVDNFQGEENEIVLLSLVRSNAEGAVGFLSINNRVCVAMSRAKCGLFVIGNMDQLALKSKLWEKILKSAKLKKGVVGDFMRLRCGNHTDHESRVVDAEDFDKCVPDGGCHRPCTKRLKCGHQCPKRCHVTDEEHEDVICKEMCMKSCPQGHPCEKPCAEYCGNCEVLVNKRIPYCDHWDKVQCYVDVDSAVCKQTCGQLMVCGHKCRGGCGHCHFEGEHAPCQEMVEKTWSSCGHTSSGQCYIDTRVAPCPIKCSTALKCGHKCQGTCGECLSGRVHVPCAKKCEKPLPCGHPCPGPCQMMCVPCTQNCPWFCRHQLVITPCNKKCGELCDICPENCGLTCKHKKCKKRCIDECSEPECDRKCIGPVPKCGHQCASLCGELCVCYSCERPKFSLIDFNKKRRPTHLAAHEQRERDKKFELTQDDILMKIPRCHHLFTLKQLDRYVDGQISSGTSFLPCPECSLSIHGIARYENKMKQRNERRERVKEAIIESTRVPVDKISTLTKSLAIVGKFRISDRGVNLLKTPENMDANVAKSITMQIRFARAISEVCGLHQKHNNKQSFLEMKWKRHMESCSLAVTPQFLEEMPLELHRLLLIEQACAVKNIVTANEGAELRDDQSLKPIGEYREKKLESRARLRELQSVLDSIYQTFDQLQLDSETSRQITDLRKQVAMVGAILDEPEDKDLCEIIPADDTEDETEDETEDGTWTDTEDGTEDGTGAETEDETEMSQKR